MFDNKDRALLPGLFVRVRVPVGHEDKALLVRDDAIGSNQLGNYVLVLGKDDIVEQKQVKTGQREGRSARHRIRTRRRRLGRDGRYPAGHPRQQGRAGESRVRRSRDGKRIERYRTRCHRTHVDAPNPAHQVCTP